MNKFLIAIIALAPTVALAQPEETVRVQRGIASVYKIDTADPFATVNIGNSTIADVVPLTDRSLIIQGHRTGTTNIIFVNRSNIPIKNLMVVVDEQGSGFVQVHNKALLNSFTAFSCWSNGCQFVGENTVSEPAPLPRGNYSSNYNQASPPGLQPPTPLSLPVDR